MLAYATNTETELECDADAIDGELLVSHAQYHRPMPTSLVTDVQNTIGRDGNAYHSGGLASDSAVNGFVSNELDSDAAVVLAVNHPVAVTPTGDPYSVSRAPRSGPVIGVHIECGVDGFDGASVANELASGLSDDDHASVVECDTRSSNHSHAGDSRAVRWNLAATYGGHSDQ